MAFLWVKGEAQQCSQQLTNATVTKFISSWTRRPQVSNKKITGPHERLLRD